MISNNWSIDWISTTFKGGLTDIQVRDAVSFGFPKKAWVTGTPRYGYAHMLQHPMGHNLMFNPNRNDMGIHLSLTGRSLRAMHEGGHSQMDMLKWCLREGGKITRLDLAVDVFDQEIDILALAASPRIAGAPGSARKWSSVKGSDGGVTAYIGSRQSEKFLRIYDKAIESKNLARPWVRFELEIKGDTAKKVAAAFIALPEGEHARYIKGIMKAMFNPDNALYQEIMAADAVHVSGSKDTDDTTLEWLVDSVAKTLAKTIHRRSDVDVLALFQDAVRMHYESLILKEIE